MCRYCKDNHHIRDCTAECRGYCPRNSPSHYPRDCPAYLAKRTNAKAKGKSNAQVSPPSVVIDSGASCYMGNNRDTPPYNHGCDDCLCSNDTQLLHDKRVDQMWSWQAKDLSMPGYVDNALIRFGATDLKGVNSPLVFVPPVYGPQTQIIKDESVHLLSLLRNCLEFKK